MTSSEKQEKLNKLRETAKDLQAELGWIALQRESQDKRWVELRTALEAGAKEYEKVSSEAVDPDSAA